ncbi:hypothetical protein Tco_0898594 [Tanacetum coccineum]
MGAGSTILTDPHHTPTIIQPSTSQPQKKQRSRRPKRKDIEVPQPSGLTTNVVDEAVYEERDGGLERDATTAIGLDAEQDRGNINKTQSKATPNEPSSPGTSSGGGPRRQENMGDTIAQTRSENVSKFSNDPLLTRVIDLEKTKTAQAQEITSLTLRVKKLEKKGGLRTHKLKRLYKVGRSARIVSSNEASLDDQEDASKQGSKIDDIDKDAEITLVDETQGRYGDDIMFDVSDLAGEEVFVTEQGVSDKDVNLSVDESHKRYQRDRVCKDMSTDIEVTTTAAHTHTAQLQAKQVDEEETNILMGQRLTRARLSFDFQSAAETWRGLSGRVALFYHISVVTKTNMVRDIENRIRGVFQFLPFEVVSLSFVLEIFSDVTPPDTKLDRTPFGGCDRLVLRAKVIENQVMAIFVILVSSNLSEDNVGTSTRRVILIDIDIPDTPPSPTHGIPFTKTTLCTQSTPVSSGALRRRVMVLATGQPFPHDDSLRDSSSSSSSETSLDSSADALSDSASSRSSSDHSLPTSSSGMRPSHHLCSLVPSIHRSSVAISERPSHDSSSASPSRKRSRSHVASVPLSLPTPGALSYARAGLLPSPKRIRRVDFEDESFESSRYRGTDLEMDVDVVRSDRIDIDPKIQAEIDECIAYADALRDRGIDARFVVEAIDREEIETGIRGLVEAIVDRVTHPVRFHDHTEEIPVCRVQVIESVQRDQGHNIIATRQQSADILERIRELERDNMRLRDMMDVES